MENNNTFDALANLSQVLNPNVNEMGILPIIFILLTSLAASFFISMLYVFFFGKNTTGSQIHRSFPMLGLSITGIFISIQFSLPLSLGLLGALSIIRFRTPIKEPEEVGFIMLVIASSLGCATFNLFFLVVFLLISVLGLVLLKYFSFFDRSSVNGGIVMITMNKSFYESDAYKVIADKVQSLSKKVSFQSLSQDEDQLVVTYEIKNIALFDADKVREIVSSVNNEIKVNVYLNDSRINAY